MKLDKYGEFYRVERIKESTRRVVIEDIDSLDLESQIILWELQNPEEPYVDSGTDPNPSSPDAFIAP